MNKPKLETITPEVARAMLIMNTHNLPHRQSHIDFLASEMSSGRWNLTHQGIAFDGKTLVDGQHRLMAVIQSGVTIQSWVFGDVPLAVQEQIDKGRIRSIADELGHFHGVKATKQKIPACRSIVSMCCYFQGIKTSNGLIKDILLEIEPQLDEVIEALEKFKPGHKQWVVAALAWALKAEPSLSAFVRGIGTGENLKTGDPAKAVRDWLSNGFPTSKKDYARNKIEGVLNAAFNAINNSRLSSIRRGHQGFDYFTGKNRKIAVMIREKVKQQMEVV